MFCDLQTAQNDSACPSGRKPFSLALSTRVRSRDEAAKASRQKKILRSAGPSFARASPEGRCSHQEKSWKRPGEVVRQCAPRSYIIVVKTANGELRRNRKVPPVTYRTSTEDPAPDGEQQPPPKPEVPVQPPAPPPPSQQPQVPASTGTPPQSPAKPPPVRSSLTQSPQPYLIRSGRCVISQACQIHLNQRLCLPCREDLDWVALARNRLCVFSL
ncbi:hypothetical protein BaRGS_00025057 [Batillaria attramentaria]|uniref:Uncharacterized protein n=1 Tax=Batillaria attramentaria TaxID=370345 RepID=A0ABD0K9F5_9CAEN